MVECTFNFEQMNIEGMRLITPFIAGDRRGYMLKFYERRIFEEHNVHLNPFEEMQSQSRRGTLRGLHYQRKHSQDKLVRVIRGTVFDVGVDLRADSPTFGDWAGVILSDENRKMLYIPKGFAHGFLALTDDVIFSYICGDQYDPDSESGICWNDPDLGINWPLSGINHVTLSEKDRHWQSFHEFAEATGGLSCTT